MRIFYEHENLLNPDRVSLIDHFQKQPQNDLNLRFTTPTVLTETYAHLKQTLKHSPLPAQAPQAQVLSIPNIREFANQHSTTELAIQLLKGHEQLAQYAAELCPLTEVMRFRILLAINLQRDQIETAKLIVKLHLI